MSLDRSPDRGADPGADRHDPLDDEPDALRFDYRGPDALRRPIAEALRRVVDPEMALSILDIGLVYRIELDDTMARVAMTMTSAACPVADVIVDEVCNELLRALPERYGVEVELVWEPPWQPQRMSAGARRFMGW